MNGLMQDVRYALRGMRRNPAYAIAVIVTIALGIGPNITAFSVTNALLLRSPDGVENPHQLVLVGQTRDGSEFNTLSYPDYADYRDVNTSFAALAAYRQALVYVGSDQSAERLSALLVTGNYFRALGTSPANGRTLSPQDDGAPGSNPVAVISFALWQRRFNSDSNIVGRVVTINHFPFTIVGVAEKGFAGTAVGGSVDVWLPLSMYAQADPVFSEKRFEARHIAWLSVLGRLHSAVTVERAQNEMSALAKRLQERYPSTNEDHGIRLVAGLGVNPNRRSESRMTAAILLVIAALILLIACANVANLLLAKGSARSREISVSQALGATRTRLVRQLFVEALIVSALAGVVALVLAATSRTLLLSTNLLAGIRLSPHDLRFDRNILLFAISVTVATAMVFTVIPALALSCRDMHTALRQRGPGGLYRSKLQGWLVVSQIALSLLVLICAGLFVRTLLNAQSVQLGFDADRVLTTPIDVGRAGYSEAQGSLLYKQLLSNVDRIPGVSAASLAVTAPPGGSWRTGYRIAGESTADAQAAYNIVAPRYFDTMGVTLIRGRDFSDRDNATSPRVVIVSGEFARAVFPQQNPIGKRLSIPRNPGDSTLSEIVGVVSDIKYERLTDPGRPYLYLPLTQSYQPTAMLFVKSVEPAVADAVRREVQALIPNMPAGAVRALSERLQASLAPQRSSASLLGALGLLGLLLACVGVYSVLAYAVARRRNEVGIRMALGASRSSVITLILREGFILIVAGAAMGLVLAAASTRFMTNQLFGVTPTDPLTYIAVTSVLIVTALAACYLPARRAARVDPLVALRYE
jgi:macrolide transport system ATP-binding/permease protein